MSAPVIVYSAPGCSECNSVKQMLAAEGIAYEVRDVLASEEYQQEVESLGFMGIPVTVAGGRAIKGFNAEELKSLIMAAAQ